MRRSSFVVSNENYGFVFPCRTVIVNEQGSLKLYPNFKSVPNHKRLKELPSSVSLYSIWDDRGEVGVGVCIEGKDCIYWYNGSYSFGTKELERFTVKYQS